MGMRHVLVHDHFAIDVEVVWDAVEGDLPILREQIQALLQELEGKQ